MISSPQPGTAEMQRTRFWKQPRFWLGIASSLLFLWLVSRQVSWPRVLEALKDADWNWIAMGLLLLIVTWALFAVRWQCLLAPAAPVPWSDAFAYILIGYLGNAVLPLRLGDAGRIVLLGKKHAISIAFTSATVVLERLLDILTVLVFVGLLMLVTPVPELIRRGVQATAVVAFLAFLVLVLLSRSQVILARLETLASTHLPEKIVEPWFDVLHRFIQGLQVTSSPGLLLKVGSLSVLSWGIAGLSILCFVRAFKLALPWHAAMLVLTVTNLGGALPSSPGAIGVYEFLSVLALSVWMSERSVALGFALVTHAASLALSVILGLIAAWREGIRLSVSGAESRHSGGGRARASEVGSSTSGREQWENSSRKGDPGDE